MTHFLIFLSLLLSIPSCSHSNITASEKGAAENSPNLASDFKSDPRYPQALAFDQLLWDKLPPNEAKSLIEECKKKNDNPFCTPVKQLRALQLVIAQKSRIYKPSEIKPLIPATPVVAKGNVQNWNALRKALVPNLLKGILSVSFDDLKVIGVKATQEKRCPNNIAIAVAATLEDHMPMDISPTLIADLYARGAKCSKKMPLDREHFLTRAGLFYLLAKDPKTAVTFFSQVNPVDAYTGRALYWLYRTKQMLSDAAGAKNAYTRLQSHHKFSFHALVGANLEKEDIGSVLTQSLVFPTRSKRLKKINNAIESAEILKRLGFDNSATIIVDWILDHYEKLEADLKIYLTQLGDDNAKVTTVPGVLLFHPELISKESMQLDFPRAFFPLFDKNRGKLSPYLLLAVSRRESSFNPNAVSPANAKGLLQLNPETVQTIAPEKLSELLDPNTNISIGAKYLADILDRMNGNLTKALASYNAGEAAVKLWEKRYLTSDPMLWMDLIPYRETRDYVSNVLSSYYWYRRIYENSTSLSEVIP